MILRKNIDSTISSGIIIVINHKRGAGMEFWDIYDREKHVTGRRMSRNDWHMKPGVYHLTVLALIRDRAGRILITQRKADK